MLLHLIVNLTSSFWTRTGKRNSLMAFRSYFPELKPRTGSSSRYSSNLSVSPRGGLFSSEVQGWLVLLYHPHTLHRHSDSHVLDLALCKMKALVRHSIHCPGKHNPPLSQIPFFFFIVDLREIFSLAVAIFMREGTSTLCVLSGVCFSSSSF